MSLKINGLSNPELETAGVTDKLVPNWNQQKHEENGTINARMTYKRLLLNAPKVNKNTNSNLEINSIWIQKETCQFGRNS